MDENKNSADRDHSVFPEVVTSDGVVLSPEEVAYAYTREGRHQVGVEYPNPVPLEAPLGYVPSKPLYEQIREMVQKELSEAAAAAGMETLEESEDFDVGDDMDPMSPWELEYEPTRPWFTSVEVEAAERRALAARQEAELRGGGGAQPPSAKPSSDAPASPAADSSAANAKPPKPTNKKPDRDTSDIPSS